MYYRKDLLEGSRGLERFVDYISLPAQQNYSGRYYTDAGQKYLPWIRGTAGIAMLAIVIAVVA